jgi:hypothetical protein
MIYYQFFNINKFKKININLNYHFKLKNIKQWLTITDFVQISMNAPYH